MEETFHKIFFNYRPHFHESSYHGKQYPSPRAVLSPKKRSYDARSPKSRNIVLLSPQRSRKPSRRDKILDEKELRPKAHKTPIKKKVHDRLGFRNDTFTEVFNMDNNKGN